MDIALIIGAVVVLGLVACGLFKGKGEPTQQPRSSDQRTAAVAVRSLEQARGFEPGVRDALVNSLASDDLLPGVNPGDPLLSDYEALLRRMRQIAEA